MRYFLAAIFLTALFAAGCEPEADRHFIITQYIYPPVDTTGNGDDTTGHADSLVARILSPAPNTTLEMIYDWHDVNPPPSNTHCHWWYDLDTLYAAHIVVDLPGVTRSAQVYARNYYGQFQAFMNTVYPNSDTFSIDFYQASRQYWYLPTDSLHMTFFVRGSQSDTVHWTTDTISVWLSPRSSAALQPPLPPVLDTLWEHPTSSGIAVNWCQQAPFVDYVLVSWLADGASQAQFDSIPGNANSRWISDYYANTHYTVQVFVGNSLGRSPGSNTLSLTTHDPHPPTNLQGACDSDGYVSLSWYNNYYHQDSVLVGRRELAGDWSILASIMNVNNFTSSHYLDTSATRREVYYYRVGIACRGNLLWGADSLGMYIR